MSLTRIVDGKTVLLSADEEAAIRAEWAANDPAKAPAPAKRVSADDLAALLKAKGVLTAADVTTVMK